MKQKIASLGLSNRQSKRTLRKSYDFYRAGTYKNSPDKTLEEVLAKKINCMSPRFNFSTLDEDSKFNMLKSVSFKNPGKLGPLPKLNMHLKSHLPGIDPLISPIASYKNFDLSNPLSPRNFMKLKRNHV